jgi:hypothetical protein
MKNPKTWIWLVLFGSLWGVAEVVAGEFLWANDIPFPSVWLTAWGFFVLALARGLVPSPGSSAVVGGVATLYKLINASPFYCHLLGILALGVAFDVAATLLLKKETKAVLRRVLTGIIGVYAGSALFSFLITYIIKYDPWVEGGLPKILRHIFVSGSLSAACAAILVPLGIAWGLGAEKSTVSSRRPAWAAAGATVLIVILWAAGQLAKVHG